jgi:solute carrier family 25 citrate transporter 1
MSRNNNNNKKTPLLTHLVAGGAAGFMEACSCHPLDTIKVRMQLSKNGSRGANVSNFVKSGYNGLIKKKY